MNNRSSAFDGKGKAWSAYEEKGGPWYDGKGGPHRPEYLPPEAAQQVSLFGKPGWFVAQEAIDHAMSTKGMVWKGKPAQAPILARLNALKFGKSAACS